MDAAGIATRYVMDTSTSLSAGGDHPLSADSAGDTTFYLYGLGPIAEQNGAWAYSLPDGTNTPRQLTDAQGEIILAVRYTPWGDTLETYGIGNFTFGYFGGLMDAATGLLYVGNGQYYDPLTGRFLTRGVNPDSPNPYIPWNPLGAVIGPLGLIALVYGRKKKGNKWGVLILLLLFAAVGGVSLSACKLEAQDIGITPPSIPIPFTATVTQTESAITAAITAGDQKITITAPAPTSTPDFSDCISHNPNDPTGEVYGITGILNVLFFEGASSFPDRDDRMRLLEKELWALRSEKLYDTSNKGMSYEEIVKSSKYTAATHFEDSGLPCWTQEHIQMAEKILYENGGGQYSPPPGFDNRVAIYFISTSHFLRVVPGKGYEWIWTDVKGLSKCAMSHFDPQNPDFVCNLPDIRWIDTLRSKSLLGPGGKYDERFISLPKGTYKLWHETTNYDECYWIGLYFTDWNNHLALFNAGNDPGQWKPVPTDADAPQLLCRG